MSHSVQKVYVVETRPDPRDPECPWTPVHADTDEKAANDYAKRENSPSTGGLPLPTTPHRVRTYVPQAGQ